jgi:hypothetical protein
MNEQRRVVTAEELNRRIQSAVMDKSSATENHTRTGNDPVYWVITARSLFAASKAVKDERERVNSTLQPGPAPDIITTLWTHIMLTAFGVECLIKAIWILQGHQLARDGKYVGMTDKEKPHELVKLCDIAAIPLNERESDVLQRMSDIGKSIGRYPIGRTAETRSRYWSSNDDHVIENFVARLKAQIRQMRSPRASQKARRGQS